MVATRELCTHVVGDELLGNSVGYTSILELQSITVGKP